jgi:hypothetical protein
VLTIQYLLNLIKRFLLYMNKPTLITALISACYRTALISACYRTEQKYFRTNEKAKLHVLSKYQNTNPSALNFPIYMNESTLTHQHKSQQLLTLLPYHILKKYQIQQRSNNTIK